MSCHQKSQLRATLKRKQMSHFYQWSMMIIIHTLYITIGKNKTMEFNINLLNFLTTFIENSAINMGGLSSIIKSILEVCRRWKTQLDTAKLIRVLIKVCLKEREIKRGDWGTERKMAKEEQKKYHFWFITKSIPSQRVKAYVQNLSSSLMNSSCLSCQSS